MLLAFRRCSQGFPRRNSVHPLIWMNTLSELQVLPTGRAVYKLDIPVMFTRVASEEFLSLTVLSDSAPSSEFLHHLVHDKVLISCMRFHPHREIWRNYPQVSRTCDERSLEPKETRTLVPHGIRLPGISPSRSFRAAKKILTVTCGSWWFRIVHEDGPTRELLVNAMSCPVRSILAPCQRALW